jgi:hypothetical protein
MSDLGAERDSTDGPCEPCRAPPTLLRQGLLLRESLTGDPARQVHAIFTSLAPYLDQSFGKFEITFLREPTPDCVIATWSQIRLRHSDFLKQRPDTTADVGSDLFLSLLMILTDGIQPAEVPESRWDAVHEFLVE